MQKAEIIIPRTQIEKLKSITDESQYTFVTEEPIGIGGYGIVFKVIHRYSRHYAALKVIPITQRTAYEKEDVRQLVLSEITIMKDVGSLPGMLPLYFSRVTDDFVLICMEYCPGGSIEKYIKRNGEYLEESLIQSFFYQICCSLLNLHSTDRVHRDIKPENILIGSDGRLKLADLGLARGMDGRSRISSSVGTIRYFAPEVLNSQGQSIASDIWSLGVVMLELAIEGNNLVNAEVGTLCQKKIKKKLSYKTNYSREMIDCISSIFEQDSRLRPNVQALLLDKWIKKLDDTSIAPILYVCGPSNSVHSARQSPHTKSGDHGKKIDKYVGGSSINNRSTPVTINNMMNMLNINQYTHNNVGFISTNQVNSTLKKGQSFQVLPNGKGSKRQSVNTTTTQISPFNDTLTSSGHRHNAWVIACQKYPILYCSVLTKVDIYLILIKKPEFHRILSSHVYNKLYLNMNNNNEFYLSHNMSKETEDFYEMLVIILMLFSNLIKLSFWNCKIGDVGIQILCTSFIRLINLKTLVLTGCNMNDDSCRCIALCLKYMKNLEILWLGGNLITDSGCTDLSCNLLPLSKLREISLCENQITDSGVSGLLSRILQLQEISYISLCNNTKITNASILPIVSYIKANSNLKSFVLVNTSITTEKLNDLQLKYPKIKLGEFDDTSDEL